MKVCFFSLFLSFFLTLSNYRCTEENRSTGEQGETGTPGRQGETGQAGPTGLAGDQGEVGPTGTEGEIGSTGPSLPVIQSLTVHGLPANPEADVTGEVFAQSASEDTLSYQWVASSGWTITGGDTAPIVTIKAPNLYAANGTATVTVTDTHSRYAVGTIALSTTGNYAPIISYLSAFPNPVGKNGTLLISVEAVDLNNNPLSYFWSVPAGWTVLTGNGTSQLSVQAPDVYNSNGSAGIRVEDAYGGSAEGALWIATVLSPSLIISGIEIYPQPVLTSANISLNVYNSNGDPLSYEWTIGGISYSEGDSWTWNSPGIPGYYIVMVDIQNGDEWVAMKQRYMYLSSLSPWPKFRGNLQNTGLSPVNTAATTNGVKWAYQTGAGIVSSPTVAADGVIYVGSRDHYVYAIHPYGELKWRFYIDPAEGEIHSSPTIASDGTVYIGTHNKSLYAIYPNGSQKWAFPTNDKIISSPTIGADGTIYFGSENFYALYPNGSLKWTAATNRVTSAAAIGTDGTIYVTSVNSPRLYAINPNGSILWSYPVSHEIYASPAIGLNGTIYFGSSVGKLYAINPNGSLNWSYNAGANISDSPAIGLDGTIYIGSLNPTFNAINPSGSLKWAFLTDLGNITSSPAIGLDGTIYIAANKQNTQAILYAIYPDGTQKWSMEVGVGNISSSPAIGSDGTIYIGSNDGKLYAIR